jgi:hypothetical protein
VKCRCIARSYGLDVEIAAKIAVTRGLGAGITNHCLILSGLLQGWTALSIYRYAVRVGNYKAGVVILRQID